MDTITRLFLAWVGILLISYACAKVQCYLDLRKDSKRKPA